MEVGRAHDDAYVVAKAEFGGDLWFEWAEDVDGAFEVGEFVAVNGGEGDEFVMVDDVGDVAVVGEPVKGDRFVRGGELTGKAEVEVIFWFEEFVGLAVDVGVLVFDVEDVGDGIFAGVCWCSAGEPDPAEEFSDAISCDFDRAVGDMVDVACSARVHPA